MPAPADVADLEAMNSSDAVRVDADHICSTASLQ
jgi:hypothetical protein